MPCPGGIRECSSSCSDHRGQAEAAEIISGQLLSCNPWKARRALLSKGIDYLEMSDYTLGVRSWPGIKLGVATPNTGQAQAVPAQECVWWQRELLLPPWILKQLQPLIPLSASWCSILLSEWKSLHSSKSWLHGIGGAKSSGTLSTSTAPNTDWVSPGSSSKLNWAPVKIRKVVYCSCTALPVLPSGGCFWNPPVKWGCFHCLWCGGAVLTALNPQFIWEWIGKNKHKTLVLLLNSWEFYTEMNIGV